MSIGDGIAILGFWIMAGTMGMSSTIDTAGYYIGMFIAIIMTMTVLYWQ